MKIFQTTKKWTDWWSRRKIDWKAHYMNPQHPHRRLITQTLQHLSWKSLFEVGCGAGANLVVILKTMPDRQVGGIDINKDAIKFAETQFQNGIFRVGSADNVMLSDGFTDVILSDMMLIYITPNKIGKYLAEFKRLARNYVVLCELHSESWLDRLAIRLKEGYNVYDWRRILEKNDFYDIALYKIPKEFWPESDLQQKYGTIIVARVPKR